MKAGLRAAVAVAVIAGLLAAGWAGLRILSRPVAVPSPGCHATEPGWAALLGELANPAHSIAGGACR